MDRIVEMLNKIPGLNLMGIDTSNGWQNLKQNFSLTQFLVAISAIILSVTVVITMVIGAATIKDYPVTRPSKQCVAGSDKWLLPNTVVPIHYHLRITPSLSFDIFAGELLIDINVAGNQTTCIKLHSYDLNIFRSQLITSDGVTINPSSVTVDRETEMIIMNFDSYIPEGQHQLSFNYEAKIRSDYTGFFKSGYKENGVQKYVYATQFEATHARKAFPCFDEPALKATFKLSIAIDKDDMKGNSNFTVLSNTEIEEVADTFSGRVLYSYKTTLLMSTYNLAWSIGNLVSASYVSPLTGVTFNIWSTPLNSNRANFGLIMADYCTNFYSLLFGISYPLPKIDLIALPDFLNSAMENWGMITFQDNLLLVDEKTVTQDQKQLVAQVICHEIAHQWTGNLVTASWWSDIWLNEGITTFMEALAVETHSSTWEMFNTFNTDNVRSALRADSMPSAHPLVEKVSTPSEINGMFDTITYNKGGAVMKMLYNFMGESIFKQWMQNYIQTNAFSSVNTTTLWDSLLTVAANIPNAPTKKLLQTWITEPGFPIVTVHNSFTTQNGYFLTQNRFVLPSSTPVRGHRNGRWWVPIKSIDSNGNSQDLSFYTMESEDFVVNAPWFKLNAGQVGYYRVNYPISMWNQFVTAIHGANPAISNPLDRFGLVDDVFALARIGEVPIELAFNITDALEHETSFEVWDSALTNLDYIAGIIYDTSSYGNFKKFIREHLHEAYTFVGWNVTSNESTNVKKLRTLIISHGIRFGDTEIIQDGLQVYKLNPNNIPSEIRLQVFRSVVRASEAGYTTIYNRYLNAVTLDEKRDALIALASTTYPYLLTNTLHLALSPSVSPTDAVPVILAVSLNVYGRLIAWDFVKEHWGELSKILGNNEAMSALLPITRYFSTLGKFLEVQNFFKTVNPNGPQNILESALDEISSNIKFIQQTYPSIDSWLYSQYANQASAGL